MIGNLFLLQVVVGVIQARPNDIGKDILEELAQNDANLNPGFDLQAFRVDQLNLHNHYRRLHGVPPMRMDSTLQRQAQQYAEVLAKKAGRLFHCKPPSCDRHGAGENLAMASGSTTSAETNATKQWYDEVWDYNYCTGRKRPGHKNKPIGHFTQVVWKTSTKLGIGYARSRDRKKVYVVGRYLKKGNVNGKYLENVPKANYLFKTFQDNCNGIAGGFTAWSAAGKCSRSCGGGVRFQTRKCTNPKPSFNGADCNGDTKKLAALKWCNVKSCSSAKNHRDQQCAARGYPAKSYNFEGGSDCTLHCRQSRIRNYNKVGKVDDGTHCNSDSGVCVSGKCNKRMSKYVSLRRPQRTSATGSLVGSYTKTPSKNIWNNEIWTIPNGATNIVITNKNYRSVRMYVGYKSSGSRGYKWAEESSMRNGYKTTRIIFGVTFKYLRQKANSKITITGPVTPTSGYNLVLFVKGSSPAQISWRYKL